MAASELFRRVAVAAVGIPVVLGVLWLGGWPLGILVGAAAALSALEFFRLAQVRGIRPFSVMGAVAAGALVLLATAFPTPAEFGRLFLGVVLLVGLLSLAAAIWLRWPGGEPLEAAATTLMGVLYTGGTLAFIPILRGFSSGSLANRWYETGFVLLPLLTTWAGDSAAYFVGRAFGRTKLAPAQSPGKTVEGALAGLVGSVAAALVVSAVALGRLPVFPVPLLTAAWIGLALGVAAQLGDLAESVLKREAGVKDSGRLLPGHGGMLDRLDSLFFAVPATWGLLLAAGVIP